MIYTITLRKQRLSATTLDRLSSMYAKMRDDSGEGASTFPTPLVRVDGKIVASISYNAKIWTVGPDRTLLFSPYDNPRPLNDACKRMKPNGQGR